MWNSLWEEAADKKARGVEEVSYFLRPCLRKRRDLLPLFVQILNAFPLSRFLLFGDSAEQDLHLYTTLALARPHQVVGIFIRDVSPPGSHTPAIPVPVVPKRKTSGDSVNPVSATSTEAPKRPGNKRAPGSRSSLSSFILSRSNSSDALSPNNPAPDMIPTLPTSPSVSSISPPESRSSSAPTSPTLESTADADDIAAEATIATAKIIKRVAEFKAKFEDSDTKLKEKGVKLRKFRKVEEIREELEKLVFGEK